MIDLNQGTFTMNNNQGEVIDLERLPFEKRFEIHNYLISTIEPITEDTNIAEGMV